MGYWFTAKRDSPCKHCNKPLLAGAEVYMKTKGVVLCHACGLLSEATSDSPAVGAMRAAVLKDLAAFPDEATESTIAQTTLYMASQLDAGDVSPREVTNYTKEIRINLMQLRELYPPAGEEDATDRARRQREQRMREINGI